MGKLTALKVKSITKAGRYSDGEGLMLVVKKSGSKSWVLRIQVNGRRSDIGLGSLKTITLLKAREEALEIRKRVAGGAEAKSAKRLSATLKMAPPSFEDAATAVHKEMRVGWKNGKHCDQWISTLALYVFPSLGQVTVDKITAADIIQVLRPIWLAIPETARRVRQRIKAVLNWAHAMGYRQSEAPTSSIDAGLPKQPKRNGHFAAMPHPEVAQFMQALSASSGMGSLALQFTVLTAARSGEVRGAVWEEFDIDGALWTIPGNRMKGGREHVVPLSAPAVALLRTLYTGRRGDVGEPVFSGPSGKRLSDMTLTKALRVATKKSATVHGFRSSFRDWAAEMTSYPPSAIESALAHVNPNKVEAAYRRTNFLEVRKSVMNDWAKYVV